jgi:phosphoribosylformylglycinamidine cyclo-ligase
MTGGRYAESGVDIGAGDAAKQRIGELVRATHTAASRGLVGGFGGMFRVPADIADPVIVASTDGVGTKVLVAIEAGKHDTVGEDLVNHCVNDILVHGARPAGFLDYFATGKLDADILAEVVSGVARGCRAHGMPLLGGETAQMAELYGEHEYDLAGTIIGVVSEREALHGDRVQAGDVLVGYAANGFHTNGYTLVRRVLRDDLHLGVHDPFPETNETVAEVLLCVHRSYFAAIWPVRTTVHALAHITGGGIPGNLDRVLPKTIDAVVRDLSWPQPVACRVIQKAGRIERDEMRRVFNMGVGMIAVCAEPDIPAVRAAATSAGVDTWVIGRTEPGTGAVRYE